MYSKFEPNYAVPPIETIVELMEAKGLNQKKMEELSGQTKEEMNKIFIHKERISDEILLSFANILGVTPTFLINLQEQYLKRVENLK